MSSHPLLDFPHLSGEGCQWIFTDSLFLLLLLLLLRPGRTSTWTLRDLNRKRQIAAGTTGPQPQVPENPPTANTTHNTQPTKHNHNTQTQHTTANRQTTNKITHTQPTQHNRNTHTQATTKNKRIKTQSQTRSHSHTATNTQPQTQNITTNTQTTNTKPQTRIHKHTATATSTIATHTTTNMELPNQSEVRTCETHAQDTSPFLSSLGHAESNFAPQIRTVGIGKEARGEHESKSRLKLQIGLSLQSLRQIVRKQG